MNLAVSIAAVEGAIAPVLMWLARMVLKQVIGSITVEQTKDLVEKVDKIVSEKIEAHERNHHHGRP